MVAPDSLEVDADDRPKADRGPHRTSLAVLLIAVVIGWIAVNGALLMLHLEPSTVSPIADGEVLPDFAPAGESAAPR